MNRHHDLLFFDEFDRTNDMLCLLKYIRVTRGNTNKVEKKKKKNKRKKNDKKFRELFFLRNETKI